MNDVYVLCWKYSDNSGFGIARVYFNKERSEADLATFSQHSHVDYWIETAQLDGGGKL